MKHRDAVNGSLFGLKNINACLIITTETNQLGDKMTARPFSMFIFGLQYMYKIYFPQGNIHIVHGQERITKQNEKIKYRNKTGHRSSENRV